MADPLKAMRQDLQRAINSNAKPREELEEYFGEVWDTLQLKRDFKVQSFLAPFVRVIRKSDNVEGTLTFQHSPRYYFDFQPK